MTYIEIVCFFFQNNFEKLFAVCTRVYLVVSKVIVQRIFQFTKELLFLLFLPFFSLLEDRQLSKSVSVILTNHRFVI